MKAKKMITFLLLLSPGLCMAQSTADHPDNIETWIAFLPTIIFILILLITTIKLRNDKTKLSDLLAEKDPQMIVPGQANVVNAAAAAAPAQPGTPQSVSRFIAFLTGLVALTIGVCICTFYMYVYFTKPGTKIDLSSLTNVIWGLGIGILPYGFNKASAALKQSV